MQAMSAHHKKYAKNPVLETQSLCWPIEASIGCVKLPAAITFICRQLA
jgi:hypothetical protein